MSEPATPTAVALRPGRVTDSPRIVELMNTGLRSRLAAFGRGFQQALVARMVRSPHCVVRVAERGGRVDGVALVLVDGRRFFREFVVRDGLQAAFHVLRAILSPAALRTAWGAFRYLPGAPSTDPTAEAVVLAVSTEARGTGLGTALFRAFAADLTARGVADLKLSTDVTNTHAQRFWENLGFIRLRREKLYHDTELVVFKGSLTPRAPEAESEPRTP